MISRVILEYKGRPTLASIDSESLKLSLLGKELDINDIDGLYTVSNNNFILVKDKEEIKECFEYYKRIQAIGK